MYGHVDNKKKKFAFLLKILRKKIIVIKKSVGETRSRSPKLFRNLRKRNYIFLKKTRKTNVLNAKQ